MGAIERVDELEAFVATSRAGSLSAAAARLRVPVTSISRKLARLEERLGVVLITRTTRTLRLTPEGERFLGRAQGVLDEIAAMERDLAEGNEPRGTLRLAVPTLMTQFGLLDELLRAQKAYPELSIELLVQDDPVHLIASGCDAAIVVGRPSDSSNKVVRLGKLTPVLAASFAYVEAAGSPGRPEQLVDHQCLRFVGAGGPQTHWWLVGAGGRRRHVRIGAGFSSNNSRVLFDAMLRGAGIGLATPRELRRVGPHPSHELTRVLPDLHHAPFAISALLPPEGSESARTRLALMLLRQGVDLTR